MTARRTLGALLVLTTIALTGCLPGSPVGHLDVVTLVGTTLHVAGWSYDADTGEPLEVTVTVDGTSVGTTTTGVSRPDVAAAYGSGASGSGFSVDLPVSLAEGSHQVCAWSANVGPGQPAPIGCRHVGRQAVNSVVPTLCCFVSGVVAGAEVVPGGIHVWGFLRAGSRTDSSDSWGTTPYFVDGGAVAYDSGTKRYATPTVALTWATLVGEGVPQVPGSGFDAVLPTTNRPTSVCMVERWTERSAPATVETLSCHPVDG